MRQVQFFIASISFNTSSYQYWYWDVGLGVAPSSSFRTRSRQFNFPSNQWVQQYSSPFEPETIPSTLIYSSSRGGANGVSLEQFILHKVRYPANHRNASIGQKPLEKLNNPYKITLVSLVRTRIALMLCNRSESRSSVSLLGTLEVWVVSFYRRFLIMQPTYKWISNDTLVLD